VEAFAAPIKPAKSEVWKSWVGELTGSSKAEFEEMNQRYALTTHRVPGVGFEPTSPLGQRFSSYKHSVRTLTA
jgi:hypothetical protein